jgi:hypothetical protein
MAAVCTIYWMRAVNLTRTTVIGLVAIAAVALVVQMAAAAPASQKSNHVLTHQQVLHIALREAVNSRDPHPKRIEMATGSLGAAIKVTEPNATSGSVLTSPELVDLVVMHGYFHINGPHPRGSRIGPGKVLSLILSAHTGFVEARSLGNKVPALSHLGRVTRLH